MGPRRPPTAQRVPLKDPPTTGTPSDALLLQRATGRPPLVPAAGRVEPNTLVTPQYPLRKALGCRLRERGTKPGAHRWSCSSTACPVGTSVLVTDPRQKPAWVSEEYRTWSLDQFTGERRRRRERTANSSRS